MNTRPCYSQELAVQATGNPDCFGGKRVYDLGIRYCMFEGGL